MWNFLWRLQFHTQISTPFCFSSVSNINVWYQNVKSGGTWTDPSFPLILPRFTNKEMREIARSILENCNGRDGIHSWQTQRKKLAWHKYRHSFTIHTSQNMNTGSISSKESDDDNVQDDDKLPALPLAMRSDDPILDTYDAWQRDITPMPSLELPGMKDPPPLTFLHRHTSFEDFDENGTTTPTNNNSPNIRNHRIPSPLKMPYDDILRTHDAEEACVDGERLPIMSSVFPHSVCLPNLDDQQHEQTAASIINMNHTDHLFQQTNNNYAAGGIAFDRNTIPPTYNFNSIIAATSISLSTTADRNHRNSTSCEANANYDSPTRPILEDHPAIVTQSETTE